MPTSTLILVILGAARATELFMHFVEWLDTPKRKAPHPGQPTKANRV